MKECEIKSISSKHARIPFFEAPEWTIVLLGLEVDFARVAREEELQVHDLVAKQVVEHFKGGLRVEGGEGGVMGRKT